jgi:hypothetical protein
MILKDLLLYALEKYLPKTHLNLTETEYNDSEAYYKELWNSTYLNGVLYINEDLTDKLTVVERNIIHVYSMQVEDNSNGEYGDHSFGVGFLCENFVDGQEIYFKINNDIYDSEAEYYRFDEYTEKDGYLLASQLFCDVKVREVEVYVTESINNYTKYSEIEPKVYSLSPVHGEGRLEEWIIR